MDDLDGNILPEQTKERNFKKERKEKFKTPATLFAIQKEFKTLGTQNNEGDIGKDLIS